MVFLEFIVDNLFAFIILFIVAYEIIKGIVEGFVELIHGKPPVINNYIMKGEDIETMKEEDESKDGKSIKKATNIANSILNEFSKKKNKDQEIKSNVDIEVGDVEVRSGGSDGGKKESK